MAPMLLLRCAQPGSDRGDVRRRARLRTPPMARLFTEGSSAPEASKQASCMRMRLDPPLIVRFMACTAGRTVQSMCAARKSFANWQAGRREKWPGWPAAFPRGPQGLKHGCGNEGPEEQFLWASPARFCPSRIFLTVARELGGAYERHRRMEKTREEPTLRK